MRKHFASKNPCPMTSSRIVLTDEIKQHILLNRIWLPLPEAKVPHTVINYNTVVNMNMRVKVGKLFDAIKKSPMIIEDKIPKVLESELRMLASDIQGVEHTETNLSNIIGRVVRSYEKDLSDVNVIYDPKTKSVLLFDDAANGKEENGKVNDLGKELDLEGGAYKLIEMLQNNYLHEYERYLLRQHHYNDNPRSQQALLETLMNYYRFIGSFGLEAYHCLVDDYMIYDADCGTKKACNEQYLKHYKKVVESLTQAEKRACVSKVKSLIVSNSASTLKELNTAVLDMIRVNN